MQIKQPSNYLRANKTTFAKDIMATSEHLWEAMVFERIGGLEKSV